jgi:hypothetical protein
MGGFLIKHFALQMYLASVSILEDPKFNQHSISTHQQTILPFVSSKSQDQELRMRSKTNSQSRNERNQSISFTQLTEISHHDDLNWQRVTTLKQNLEMNSHYSNMSCKYWHPFLIPPKAYAQHPCKKTSITQIILKTTHPEAYSKNYTPPEAILQTILLTQCISNSYIWALIQLHKGNRNSESSHP